MDDVKVTVAEIRADIERLERIPTKEREALIRDLPKSAEVDLPNGMTEAEFRSMSEKVEKK